jgi:hypothetical protein
MQFRVVYLLHYFYHPEHANNHLIAFSSVDLLAESLAGMLVMNECNVNMSHYCILEE